MAASCRRCNLDRLTWPNTAPPEQHAEQEWLPVPEVIRLLTSRSIEPPLSLDRSQCPMLPLELAQKEEKVLEEAGSAVTAPPSLPVPPSSS